MLHHSSQELNFTHLGRLKYRTHQIKHRWTHCADNPVVCGCLKDVPSRVLLIHCNNNTGREKCQRMNPSEADWAGKQHGGEADVFWGAVISLQEPNKEVCGRPETFRQELAFPNLIYNHMGLKEIGEVQKKEKTKQTQCSVCFTLAFCSFKQTAEGLLTSSSSVLFQCQERCKDFQHKKMIYTFTQR